MLYPVILPLFLNIKYIENAILFQKMFSFTIGKIADERYCHKNWIFESTTNENMWLMRVPKINLLGYNFTNYQVFSLLL